MIFFFVWFVWFGVMIRGNWNWMDTLYCTVCIDIALLNQSDLKYYTLFPTIREAGVVSSTE